MATLSQVTEAVFTSRFDDQTTAGASAAARSLDRLGNSVEVVEERLTRSRRTAEQWVRSADQITQAESRLTKATRDLENARRALASAPDVSDEQRARTLDALNAKVTQAAARLNDLREAYAASAQAGGSAAMAAQQIAGGMDSAADATRRAAAAQSAFNEVLGVRNTGANEYSRRAAEIAGFGQELDRLQAKFQPLALAQARYRSELDDLALATRSLGLSEAEVAQQRERIKAGFAEQVRTLNGMKAAETEAARAAQQHASEIEKLKASLDGYVLATDPIAASLHRVEQAERELAQARARGVTVSDAQAAAVRRLRANHDDMVASTRNATGEIRLQAHEWTNLSYQLQDFVVQVGSGQGVFRPLLQQAPQATGAVGGVGNAMRLVTQALTPLRVATGAAAVAGAALAIAYNSQEGALARMQTRLRAVTSDYEAMGRRAEAAARAAAITVPGLSLENARSAQIALATAAPRGSSFDLGALTAQAADFAAVMGIEVTAGVERFAQAMRDPVALVDELAKQNFPGMNEQLRLTAQRMVEGGQRADAFALVIGRLREQTEGAAERGMTPFGRAMDALSKRLESLGQEIGSFLAEPGRKLVEWLTQRLDLSGQSVVSLLSLATPSGLASAITREFLGGSQPAPAAAPDAASSAAIQQMIREEAARQGVPVEFALRIARGESNFRQFGADGSVLNNDGAIGAFQLRTAAAQDAARALGMSGFDRLTTEGNIRMGVWYAGQRLAAAGGDQREAAFRYNQGDAGYRAAMEGRNPRALVEGRAYQAQFDRPLTVTAQAVTIEGPAGATPAVSGAAVPASVPSDSQAVNRVLALARGEGTIPGQTGTLATQRAGLEELLSLSERAKALVAGNAEQVDVITAAQQRWRASLEGLRDPQEQFLRDLSRATDSANTYDPAQRAVNEAVRAYEDRMRAVGQIPTDAGREAVRTQKLAELSAAYVNAGRDAARSIEGQDRLAVAWGQGTEAVRRLAAEEQAREVVRQSGNRTEEEAEQKVRALADAYEALAAKQADNALRASNEAAERNLQYLDRERQLIGATADERERELAAYRARLNAEASGARDAAAIAQAEDLARATVDATNQTRQLSNSWQAIPSFVEDTASTIKGALVSAIASGEQRAINFGNVWRAVQASVVANLAELAVINPVLNTAFGGTRATLGGISTVIGGGGAGGTGAASYTDAGSGLLKLLRGGSGGSINTGWAWLDSGLNSTAYATGTPAAGWASDMYGPYSAANPAGGLSNVSWGQAGMGALGVLGGLYGIYSGAQQGGAKGWATGGAGAFGTLAGISSLAGGSAALGTASAGLLGAGGGAILGGLAAVAPYAAAVLAIASLFLPGQKPSDMTGVYRANLHTGVSDVTGLTGDRYSAENRDTATQIGQQVQTLAESLKSALGVDAIPFNYEIAIGQRDGLNASYGGRVRNYTADEAGSQQLIRDITQGLVESMRGLASAEIQSIIGASGGNTETLLANLDWYNGTYKAMTARADSPISAFGQSMDALNLEFDTAVAKARELGLSEGKLNEVRQAGIQALFDQRNETLRAIEVNDRQRQVMANGTNTLAEQIAAFNEAALAEAAALRQQLRDLGLSDEQIEPTVLRRWETLEAERQNLVFQDAMARGTNTNALYDRIRGAQAHDATLDEQLWDYDRKALLEYQQAQRDGITDLTLLAQAQAAERLAIERNYAAEAAALAEQAAALEQQQWQTAQQTVASVITSLTDYARGLQYGETSALSWRDQYNLAASDFSNTAAAALSGDWASIQQAQAFSQTFLEASRAVNGSGAQYAADQARVMQLMADIAGLGEDRLTDSARLYQTNLDQLSELRGLRDLLRDLLSVTRQAATQPRRFVGR
ncbi:transglycosylase SLT domain protein [Acetobacteraceae bacterium AT-5844]|nr:transglycosylase SLT domain protein [Acetobacteraceae bacterium AT-5844]